jgi:predicted aldo/keto reductase-like oxidoreductase
MEEAIGYVLSLPGVSTVVVGCQTPAEVEENARIVREFAPFDAARREALEERTRSWAAGFTYYKKS